MHRTAGNHYGRNVYSCQSHKVSGQAFIAAGNVHAAVKWSCIGMNFNHIGNHFTACQTEIDSIGALTLAITDISSKVSRTMASGLRHTFTGCRHKLVQVAAAGVAAMGRWTAARCTCPYPLLERVKLEAQATGGTVDGIDYGAEVTLNLSLPEDAPKRLQDRLTELSAGRLRLELGETQLRPGPREEI